MLGATYDLKNTKRMTNVKLENQISIKEKLKMEPKQNLLQRKVACEYFWKDLRKTSKLLPNVVNSSNNYLIPGSQNNAKNKWKKRNQKI